MSEYKPEDLKREHIAEIEARVRATICPTFGSIERGGPPVETRQGRIFADDFEALLRYAQAGAQAMRDLEKAQEALRWYGSQVYNCNNYTTIGDVARDALAKDGGSKARAALQVKP